MNAKMTAAPAVPSVAETADLIKAEILQDVRLGVFRADQIVTFSDLHDFVDANCYGRACDDDFRDAFGPEDDDAATEAWMDHCNKAQNIVAEWIRQQGHYAAVVPVGARVTFRKETPQYAKNAGLVYTVTSSVNVDNTHDDGPRGYVVLVLTEDASKSPSRQRVRTAYVTALQSVED